MIDCPYTEQCQRSDCNFACVRNGVYLSWRNRCGLKLDNPAFKATKHDVIDDTKVIKAAINDERSDSRFVHLSFVESVQSKKAADRIVYTILGKYIDQLGVSNGIFEIDLDNYISMIKDSWSHSEKSQKLIDTQIQIKSARYLIVYNLNLVRFGDFESQTLLRIYQDRSDTNKFTITVVGAGKHKLFVKNDSVFYHQLKDEVNLRGVDL